MFHSRTVVWLPTAARLPEPAVLRKLMTKRSHRGREQPKHGVRVHGTCPFGTQVTAFDGDYRDLNGRPGGKRDAAL